MTSPRSAITAFECQSPLVEHMATPKNSRSLANFRLKICKAFHFASNLPLPFLPSIHQMPIHNLHDAIATLCDLRIVRAEQKRRAFRGAHFMQ